MGTRGRQVKQAITESVQAAAEAAKPVKSPKAPTTAGFELNPAEKAANAAPLAKRAKVTRASRRAELNKSIESASVVRPADELNRAAQALVDHHTRQVMTLKRRHPAVQEIQNMEPISLEEARRQVAAGPRPTTPNTKSFTGSEKPKTYGDTSNWKAGKKDPKIDRPGRR